jgi:hypothetical protein
MRASTLQKIDLQSLLTDLPLQFRHPAFRPALLPVAGKCIYLGPGETPGVTGPARSGSLPARELTLRSILLVPAAEQLRALQDETNGFVTFIPPAFHPDVHQGLWIMLTLKVAQVALRFGANGIDGRQWSVIRCTGRCSARKTHSLCCGRLEIQT